MNIIALPLSKIVPGNNDRKEFPKDHIEGLAKSIAAEGLHQPVTVRPIGGGKYEIVAGECRYRAHLLLNAPTIPAMVRDMDNRAASLAMLSENVQRRQLNAIDEAAAYRKRIDEFGITAEDIATWANISVDLVRRRLALLELIPDIQQQIKAGSLPLGHAECLAGLDRNNQTAAMRALIAANGQLPTVREFRRLCGELFSQQQQSALFDLESLWREKLASIEAVKPKQTRRAEELARELESARQELARLRLEKEALKLHKALGRALRAADEQRRERLSYLARRAMARYERRAF
jgi:ParB/RepB/Spo0J family partition protein